MAKIVDPDLIAVGTELTIDTSARTFTLNVAGDLVAKDGISGQALTSKFVELWNDSSYNRYPFPFYYIDARSGQLIIGFDGRSYNGWKPADDATRQMIRDTGWSEYSAAGVLNRQYVGAVTLGDVSAGAQLYYQRASGGSAINFTFTDEANEAIQVYGDASNGNFDTRTYFRILCREEGKTYDSAVLADVGETATGAFKLQLPISNADDLNIIAADAAMTTAPYNGITVTYYATNQDVSIGGTNYPFRRIIDGNGATTQEIYTKAQYLLRQSGDIDSGAGTVVGKTADELLYFVGDTLHTTQGTAIINYDSNYTNKIVQVDQDGVEREEPFTAAGTLTFNSFLVGAGSTFRMFFTTLPGAGNDYGEAGAVTVNDASGDPITGTISSGSISFDFGFDTNTQGGRTAGTDAAVTIYACRPGYAKPVVATFTLTRTTGQTIALVAEQDRAYLNP